MGDSSSYVLCTLYYIKQLTTLIFIPGRPHLLHSDPREQIGAVLWVVGATVYQSTQFTGLACVVTGRGAVHLCVVPEEVLLAADDTRAGLLEELHKELIILIKPIYQVKPVTRLKCFHPVVSLHGRGHCW